MLVRYLHSSSSVTESIWSKFGVKVHLTGWLYWARGSAPLICLFPCLHNYMLMMMSSCLFPRLLRVMKEVIFTLWLHYVTRKNAGCTLLSWYGPSFRFCVGTIAKCIVFCKCFLDCKVKFFVVRFYTYVNKKGIMGPSCSFVHLSACSFCSSMKLNWIKFKWMFSCKSAKFILYQSTPALHVYKSWFIVPLFTSSFSTSTYFLPKSFFSRSSEKLMMHTIPLGRHCFKIVITIVHLIYHPVYNCMIIRIKKWIRLQLLVLP